jgi:predicted dithiol-disulfide oxidoreductase (DUF899 family)
MLTPGSDHVCKGCSYIADHVDGARQHFENTDLSFAAISRAPIEHIEKVRQRMGWTFPWVSSNGTDFNYDFGVSFKKDDIEAVRGSPIIRSSEEMHGTSIFAGTKPATSSTPIRSMAVVTRSLPRVARAESRAAPPT